MQRNRLSVLLLAFLFLSSPLRAQIAAGTSLEVHFPNGTVSRLRLVPDAASVLFPTSQAILEMMDVRVDLPNVDNGLLKQLQFATVRTYTSKQASPTIPLEPKSMSHTPGVRITAAVFADRIYVVNQLFWGENLATINGLLRQLGSQIDSTQNALQVAKFFLQLGYYDFDNPDNFVATKIADIPPKQIEFPGQSLTEVQNAIRPPTVKQGGNGYKVDIVTLDRDSALVLLHHWSINFMDSQITNAQEEVLLPQNMHYRAREAPSDSMSGTLASPLSSLRFQLTVMADGTCSDSKGLNMSAYTFATSDGPQVRRSACYFKSTERSLTELHNQLRRASQIIELGDWKDNDGKILGERALALYSDKESGKVLAAVLLRRDTRLFEVSSPCLRNALEFEKVWFHSELKAR